jgi:hypothetical protein
MQAAGRHARRRTYRRYRGPPACPALRSCQADQAEPQTDALPQSCSAHSPDERWSIATPAVPRFPGSGPFVIENRGGTSAGCSQLLERPNRSARRPIGPSCMRSSGGVALRWYCCGRSIARSIRPYFSMSLRMLSAPCRRTWCIRRAARRAFPRCHQRRDKFAEALSEGGHSAARLTAESPDKFDRVQVSGDVSAC